MIRTLVVGAVAMMATVAQGQIATTRVDVSTLSAPGGDYTASIQAELNASTPRTLYFPPGQYTISDTLLIKKPGTQFVGCGTSSILWFSGSTKKTAVRSDPAATSAIGTLTFDSLVIAMNPAGGSTWSGVDEITQSGIYLVDTSDLLVQNCTITGFNGPFSHGLVVNATLNTLSNFSSRLRILNNVFTGNDSPEDGNSAASDIRITHQVGEAIITGNLCASKNYIGIWCNANGNTLSEAAGALREGRIVVSGNVARDKIRHGIVLGYFTVGESAKPRMTNMTITGNTLTHTGRTGIYYAEADASANAGDYIGAAKYGGLIIASNVIDQIGNGNADPANPPRGGIEIYGRRGGCVISANHLTRIGSKTYDLCGIMVERSGHVAVNDNMIEEVSSSGIFISDSCRTSVANNVIRAFGWTEAATTIAGVIVQTTLTSGPLPPENVLVANNQINVDSNLPGIRTRWNPVNMKLTIQGNQLTSTATTGTAVVLDVPSAPWNQRGMFVGNLIHGWSVDQVNANPDDWGVVTSPLVNRRNIHIP